MGQSFFIWKNKDCRSMGVRLAGPVAIVRPEERVNHVQIPGRSGDLTETEGEDVFNSYIQTASIMVHGGFRVREVYEWLRGSGYVTFSGEPDRKQPARIIGAVTLSKHSYNLDWWVGEVQFYCQPFKQLMEASQQVITASGTSVVNMGDVTSRPLWVVRATGSTVVLACGGKTLTMTGRSTGEWLVIDSETYTVKNAAETADLTKYSSGDFPVLTPGTNSVTGSNWSRVEIRDKRERYL